MTFEEYYDKVYDDATEAIIQEFKYDPDQQFDNVFDKLINDDSVTGNLSGSYSCNTAQAKEDISDLIWDDDYRAYLYNEQYDMYELLDSPETMDVIARCWILENFMYSDLKESWDYLEKELNNKEE